MRKDWEEVTLGELCHFIGGGTPSKKQPEYWGGKIPWTSIKDLKGDELNQTNDFITELGLKNSSANIVKKGEIILATRINPGKPILSKIDTSINQDLKIVRPKLKLDTKFLFFGLKASQSKVEKLSSGTTVLGINLNNLKSIDFAIPPLPEQRAIVKKLETLFSDLDQGVADLKKAQEQLKVYRQAILKKAFENIKNFDSLRNCGEWKGGGTPSKRIKEYWENGNVLWVSSRDVKTKEIHNTERKITKIAIENSSTKWIKKEALLFVMRSGILRRIFPIAIAKRELCVNQDIQTLALKKGLSPEYVYWFLKGNESNIRHTCSKDGTTVESIDATKLKEYQIPICSTDKQQQIVKEIESRLSVCGTLENNIEEGLLKAKALRQSLLKKAFEGQLLTEQELEACKKEADWEPASVLLERIKNEKVHG